MNLLADAYATWQNEIPEEELEDALGSTFLTKRTMKNVLNKTSLVGKDKEVLPR